jgi:hypothetical protein
VWATTVKTVEAIHIAVRHCQETKKMAIIKL